MFGVDLTDSSSDLDYYAQNLPGASTVRLRRLKNLFEEDPDPDPIDVWCAWNAVDREDHKTTESANARTLGTPMAGFDPAEDPTKTTDLIRIKKTYDRALEQDLEEEAAFLRGLPKDYQLSFSTFLRKHVFD